jgi:hypothetical protein
MMTIPVELEAKMAAGIRSIYAQDSAAMARELRILQWICTIGDGGDLRTKISEGRALEALNERN